MALYSYKKAKSKIIKPKVKRPFVIPMALLTVGLSILAYMGYPYISFYSAQFFKIDNISKELLSPQNAFVAFAKADDEVNPNLDYGKNIAQSIAEIDKEIKDNAALDDLSKEKGSMNITIEKLGLNNVPVNINTSSSSEAEYNPVLSHSLAHFKGTSLPGHAGKTFIYGHSSRTLVGSGKNFSSIFTDLDKMNLGDDFSIQYKDKTYKYTVVKIKVVDRDDFSVIKGDSRKTVSLMTCIPPGIGYQRLIVEAIELDDDV